MSVRVVALLVVGFLFGTGSQAQSYSDSYPKNPDIDVLGYVFDIEVTDADDRIQGRTAIDVRFVGPSSTLRLDLIGQSFQSELLNALLLYGAKFGANICTNLAAIADFGFVDDVYLCLGRCDRRDYRCRCERCGDQSKQSYSHPRTSYLC